MCGGRAFASGEPRMPKYITGTYTTTQILSNPTTSAGFAWSKIDTYRTATKGSPPLATSGLGD